MVYFPFLHRHHHYLLCFFDLLRCVWLPRKATQHCPSICRWLTLTLSGLWHLWWASFRWRYLFFHSQLSDHYRSIHLCLLSSLSIDVPLDRLRAINIGNCIAFRRVSSSVLSILNVGYLINRNSYRRGPLWPPPTPTPPSTTTTTSLTSRRPQIYLVSQVCVVGSLIKTTNKPQD